MHKTGRFCVSQGSMVGDVDVSNGHMEPAAAARIPGAVVIMVDLDTHMVRAADQAAQSIAAGPLVPCSIEEWSQSVQLTHFDGTAYVDGVNPFDQLHQRRTITGEPVKMLTNGQLQSYELTAFAIPTIDDGRTAACIFLRTDLATEVGHEIGLTNRAVLATQRSFTITDLRQEDAPLIFVNPAFERISGYSFSEAVGRNCRFLQGPATDKAAVAALRESIEAAKPLTVRLLNYRKDGSSFWNELSLAPLFDGDGVATHFVGVQTDVTAQVLAQRDLEAVYASERRAHLDARLARGRLEAILEQLPMGVRIIEPSGAMVLINEQVLKIFGLKDSARQQDWDSYEGFYSDGRKYPLDEWPIQRSLRNGEIISAEEMYTVRPDGQRRVLQVRSAPVRDETNAIVAAISLTDDITERKENERQLVEARERAAALAHTLQQSLLPAQLPVVDGMDFGSAYSPVTEGLDVGGDFYDVFEQRDGEWIVVIGDVMGKGAAAAAVTSLARHALRTAALRARRPGTLLNVLNQALLREGDGHPFCTVAAGVVTRTVHGAHLTLGLGGHPRPFVIRAGGDVEQVGHPGTLMGVLQAVEIIEVEVTLGIGDYLVMYTDGVTEAHDGATFLGEDGLHAILAKLSAEALSAEELAQALQREVVEFIGGGLKDDLAVLVVRVDAASPHVGM